MKTRLKNLFGIRNATKLAGQIWKVFIKIKQLKVLILYHWHLKIKSSYILQKALVNTWYLQTFIPIQRAAQKLCFALFHNIFYETNMLYFGKLWDCIG